MPIKQSPFVTVACDTCALLFTPEIAPTADIVWPLDAAISRRRARARARFQGWTIRRRRCLCPHCSNTPNPN